MCESGVAMNLGVEGPLHRTSAFRRVSAFLAPGPSMWAGALTPIASSLFVPVVAPRVRAKIPKRP
jgi:hypothetical protein